MPLAETVLISTELWLCISDPSNRIHTAGFWNRHDRRELINDIRTMNSTGEILSWEVVLGGTFRLQCLFAPDANFGTPSAADITTYRRMRLPTGKLVVRAAGEGQPNLLFQHEPGYYDVRLDWFVSQESLHYDIGIDQYPIGDGPDGRIIIQHSRENR